MLRKLKKLKDEKGFVSVLVVFVMCFTLPVFVFYMIEMTYLYGVKDKFQKYNDFAANAAVMQMDEHLLREGNLNVIEEEATEIANRILAENYGLHSDMVPKSNSYVKDIPIVKVYVVNPMPGVPTEIAIDEGFTYTVNHPTVIVYSEAKPKGVFFNNFVTMRSLSAYETTFKSEGGVEITSDPQVSSDGLILTMERVVNPLSLSNYPDLLPIDWGFSTLPMAAGGNFEFSLNSTKSNVTLQNAEYELKVVGEKYEKRIIGTMDRVNDNKLKTIIQIPDDAPIGSTITLNFKKSEINLLVNGVVESRGNDAIGFGSVGGIVGEVEANLFKLIRFQKKYPN